MGTKAVVRLLAKIYDLQDRYRPFADGPGMDRRQLQAMDSEIISAVHDFLRLNRSDHS